MLGDYRCWTRLCCQQVQVSHHPQPLWCCQVQLYFYHWRPHPQFQVAGGLPAQHQPVAGGVAVVGPGAVPGCPAGSVRGERKLRQEKQFADFLIISGLGPAKHGPGDQRLLWRTSHPG